MQKYHDEWDAIAFVPIEIKYKNRTASIWQGVIW